MCTTDGCFERERSISSSFNGERNELSSSTTATSRESWQILRFYCVGAFQWSQSKLRIELNCIVNGSTDEEPIDVNSEIICTRSGSWLKDKHTLYGLISPGPLGIGASVDKMTQRSIDFVARAPNSMEISWLGRCALIMLHVMKCGTPDEDTEPFNFMCKLITHGHGCDDGAEDI